MNYDFQHLISSNKFLLTVISKSGAGQLDLLILDSLYRVSGSIFNSFGFKL